MDYNEKTIEQDNHEETDHKNQSALSRIGGTLVILEFIVIFLKFFDVISWSWLWVLAPIWAPFSIVSVIAILYGMFSAFTER